MESPVFESDEGLPTYKLQRKKVKKGGWTPWEPLEVLSPSRVPIPLSTRPIPRPDDQESPAGSPPRARRVFDGIVVDSGRTPASTQPAEGANSLSSGHSSRRTGAEAAGATGGSPVGASAGSPAQDRSQRPTVQCLGGNHDHDNWLQAGFAGSRNRLQQQFLFVVLRVRERVPPLSTEDAFEEFIRELIATGAFQDRVQVGAAWSFAFQDLRPEFDQFYELSTDEIQRLMLGAWQGFK